MEVTTIRLSVIARLNIMAILNERAKGKAADKKWRAAVRVYNKIEVPDEEKETKYQHPDGRANTAAIREADVIPVELTRAEAERLEDVLGDLDLPPIAARLWYDDVMTQLENAEFKEPAA